MKATFSEQISKSPLVWISLAILAGILLASAVFQTTLIWFQLAFLSLLAAIVLKRLRPQLGLALLLLPACLFLGAARYQMALPVVSPANAAYYNDLDRKVYVTGYVAEAPDVRDTSINLRLNVTAIDEGKGDVPAQGSVLVNLTNEYTVKYGNLARVRGFLRTPTENEDFSYRDYLARQGIQSILQTSSVTILPGQRINAFWALMIRFHDSMLKRIYQLYPNPEAALLGGILLGSDKNIPGDVQQAFKDTGTAHIIAISGFNISIVSAIFLLLLARIFGKKWGSLLSILGIILYTLLVGASASVVRAAIMGSMTVIGGQFGRRNLAATGLATAALLMALINPLVLWDIGFQLSFAATLGLVLYAQPLQDFVTAWFSRFIAPENVDKIIGPFSDYFLMTFAAQLTTLPLTLYYFKRFSLISFIANPVVLPAQPAVLVLGGLSVLLSKLYIPLGQAVAWVAWPFLAYTIRLVEFLAKAPGGVLSLGEFNLLAACLFFLVLFVFTFAWSKLKQVASPALVFSILGVLAVLIWRSVLNMPDGRLHVLFMDVGSADGVLITTPSGKYILINGGASPATLSDQLGRRIPPLSRGFESLVVASTQENQVAALPRVLEQYRPKSVLWTGNPQASFSSLKLKDWLTNIHLPYQLAETNTSFDLGDGVTLRFLAVSSRGAIMSVDMGKFKTILPIGINFDALAALDNGRGLGPVTALLISDSGYAPSNPPDWLGNLKPQVAILSVAASDPDGLPSADVISSFKDYNLIRTDQNGWIDLASNGEQLWISSDHK